MSVNTEKPATIIDSLSEGFRAINRRIWLVLGPLALNLFLWFGVQLSLAPLVNDLYTLLQRLPRDASATDFQVQYDALLSYGQINAWQPLGMFNFMPTLTPYVVASMSPDDLSGSMPSIQSLPQLLDPSRAVLQIGGVGQLLLALLLVNGAALLIGAVFLTLVAEAVRADRGPLATVARRSWKAALGLLGAIAIVVGVGLALVLPFVFFAVLLLQFSLPLSLFLLSLMAIAIFWARILFGFAPEAIVVSGVGPLRALHASFNIVRRNFWGTLGFLAVSYIISVGAGVIWHTLLGSTAGLLAAIVASSYLGSGLAAARMAFYRERLRRWQTATPTVRTIA